MDKLKLTLTNDGSFTLFNPVVNEHYHSIHGAVGESVHIFIQAGLHHVATTSNTINILEVGFGTGLNALLTLIESINKSLVINYHAIEPYPLPSEIVNELDYWNRLGVPDLENAFKKLHDSFSKGTILLNNNFKFNGREGKFQDLEFADDNVNLVYFDAFSPDTEPVLWTEEVFKKVRSMMVTGGILVTYSCKGSVRRLLQACNFTTERLPGPPGKHQILRATAI